MVIRVAPQAIGSLLCFCHNKRPQTPPTKTKKKTLSSKQHKSHFRSGGRRHGLLCREESLRTSQPLSLRQQASHHDLQPGQSAPFQLQATPYGARLRRENLYPRTHQQSPSGLRMPRREVVRQFSGTEIQLQFKKKGITYTSIYYITN